MEAEIDNLDARINVLERKKKARRDIDVNWKKVLTLTLSLVLLSFPLLNIKPVVEAKREARDMNAAKVHLRAAADLILPFMNDQMRAAVVAEIEAARSELVDRPVLEGQLVELAAYVTECGNWTMTVHVIGAVYDVIDYSVDDVTMTPYTMLALAIVAQTFQVIVFMIWDFNDW